MTNVNGAAFFLWQAGRKDANPEFVEPVPFKFSHVVISFAGLALPLQDLRTDIDSSHPLRVQAFSLVPAVFPSPTAGSATVGEFA